MILTFVQLDELHANVRTGVQWLWLAIDMPFALLTSDLELVMALNPVVPDLLSLPRPFAGVNNRQLREWYAQSIFLPLDHGKHLVCAFRVSGAMAMTSTSSPSRKDEMGRRE